MFRPCVVIPVFNHPQHIERVVEQVVASGLLVVLIDDGSEADCQGLLERLAASLLGVQLLRLAVNQGKGAAVCYGLQWAFDQGFTHALQVDADGQHDLADIPRFLDLGQKFPAQVISGERIYTNAPKSRMRARKITDFWVWVNTWSLDIRDSMCGYRLYPLSATVDLLNAEMIGKRMDFDTDILVKLYWRGCRVSHVQTRVVYAPEIPSHFRLVDDNILISWMHARHFVGMLRRSPLLFWRKFVRPSFPKVML